MSRRYRVLWGSSSVYEGSYTHTLIRFLGPGFPLGLGKPLASKGCSDLFPTPGFGPGTPLRFSGFGVDSRGVTAADGSGAGVGSGSILDPSASGCVSLDADVVAGGAIGSFEREILRLG